MDQQDLPQCESTHSQATGNQQETSDQIGGQQQVLSGRNANGEAQVDNSPDQDLDARGRINVVNETTQSNPLTAKPKELQCQFCEQHVTTKVELSKRKDEMTETEKQNHKSQKRYLMFYMFFPPIWPLLPCLFAAVYAGENSSVAYHQCPNCNNMIGASCMQFSLYCTMPGPKEEQIAELRQELPVVLRVC